MTLIKSWVDRYEMWWAGIVYRQTNAIGERFGDYPEWTIYEVECEVGYNPPLRFELWARRFIALWACRLSNPWEWIVGYIEDWRFRPR